MKITQAHLENLVARTFAAWKQAQVITFKVDEKAAFAGAIAALKAELQKETALEMEVNRMLDDLERKQPGSFQRGKMYHLLKNKLAKDKKVIL